MIVVDASALVAILQDESDRRRLNEALELAERPWLSAVTFVEAAAVIDSRHGDGGAHDLDLLLARSGIDIRPVDADQARIARAAYRRFGTGNDRAGLNLGDCFSYALARISGRPLLCTGDDFAKTDVSIVVH